MTVLGNFMSFALTERMLRLQSASPGQRVAWARMSYPRMVLCPPSRPAPTTEGTLATTTVITSSPGIRRQTPPPSSPPQAAQAATDRLATRGPPLPPTTTTTTAPPCSAARRPPPPSPSPTGALCRSATASCPRPRCCRRPTATLRRSPFPRHRRCPPPPSLPPTSAAWEGCPLWCLLKTKQARWSNRAAASGFS